MKRGFTIANMTLRDQYEDHEGSGDAKVDIKLEDVNNSLWISAKGYEDHGGTPSLITMEIWEGRLRLLVWADKNEEDPTHIIDLEGAKE